MYDVCSHISHAPPRILEERPGRQDTHHVPARATYTENGDTMNGEWMTKQNIIDYPLNTKKKGVWRQVDMWLNQNTFLVKEFSATTLTAWLEGI